MSTPAPNRQLGPYELTALIGKGGMGEVWKARDPRLGRDVAIKISAQQFSDRFEREARSIAALNHPNICTLYDVGPNYLVMEFVEGAELKGPMPIDRALEIAGQIAAAIEAAHEKGIVHRDLKPANVRIKPDGTVKVLDFGLAKSSPRTEVTSDSPTLLSVSGMILGTAGYMSPEQARGQEVDKRADIFAFGVVLYEMLTGERLFAGPTLTDTLAAVLTREPDYAKVPAKVRRLLRACLEKDQRKRLRDVGDWERLLEDETSSPASSQPEPLFARALIGATAVFAVTTAVLAFLYLDGPRRAQTTAASANLLMDVVPADTLGSVEGTDLPSRTDVAISPDGSLVVFAGGGREGKRTLYQRPLSATIATSIPGTDGAEFPFFSPDGQWIGFATGNKLKKVSLNGGGAVDVCDLPTRLWGASWGAGGKIAFATGQALWTVSPDGSAPSKLVETSNSNFISPFFLPDGKTLLFTEQPGLAWDDAHVDSLSIETGQRKKLLTHASDPRYLPTGHLVFLREAALLGVAFNIARDELSGAPVPLLSGIAHSINAGNGTQETGMGQFSLSADGTLVYSPGSINPTPSSTLVRVDRNGKETKLAAVKGFAGGPRLSPDGARVLGYISNDGSRRRDLWSWEIPSGLATRLTSFGDAEWPLPSQDGKTILFSRGAFQLKLFSIPSDASGGVPVALPGDARDAAAFAPDGRWLAVVLRDSRDAKFHVTVRSTTGGSESKSIGPAKASVFGAVFSPDGRWLAYSSDESGASEVYIQSFPDPGQKHRVSADSGSSPAWSHDGRELFFLSPGVSGYRMMAVPISGGAATGPAYELFKGPYPESVPLRSYDVTRDGQFILLRVDPTEGAKPLTQIRVVLGWGEELKKRVAAAR
jgi:serine/threonine-protein kinase